MPSKDSSEQAQATAVAKLERLGLSTYAARTFVALVRLGEGTANDVSTVADVPRTRVYDAAAELQEYGLVDVQQSSPKRFWPISSETASRHFEQEYTHHVNTLTQALDDLSTPERSSEQRGVWTVTGHKTVEERVTDFVATAEDEVVFMTVGDLLSDEIVDALRAASDRGVTIQLAEMAQSTEDRLEEKIPTAKLFESIWDWSETPAGRLLLVDQEKTLVSVLVDDGNGGRQETAIWGSGTTNSLVVVLQMIFTWQLNGTRE